MFVVLNDCVHTSFIVQYDATLSFVEKLKVKVNTASEIVVFLCIPAVKGCVTYPGRSTYLRILVITLNAYSIA